MSDIDTGDTVSHIPSAESWLGPFVKTECRSVEVEGRTLSFTYPGGGPPEVYSSHISLEWMLLLTGEIERLRGTVTASARTAIDAREQEAMASKMEVDSWRRSLLVWREASHAELIENTAGLKQCLSNAARLLLDHPSLASRDAAPLEFEWPKLEKPARAGGGVFRAGVSSRFVVEAAQRLYEASEIDRTRTSEEMQEDERKRRSLWDMIHGSPRSPAAAGGVTDERAEFITWLGRSYPHAYDENDATHMWRHSHVVALAWQARAALAQPAPLQPLIDWAVERWNAEVKNRPMVNIHRRSLDDTWRQVLRHLGVDDRERLGPTHDELRAEIGSKEWEAMNGNAAPVQQCPNCKGTFSPTALDPEWKGRCECIDPAKPAPVQQEAAGSTVLQGVHELLCEAYGHWDEDREYKVGKILLALIGHNKGYDKRADAWRAALTPPAVAAPAQAGETGEAS